MEIEGNNREVKKKRLSLACNVCRRKKIKCDGVTPTCGKCLRFNLECSYTSNVKKRGPRQGHIELLEQRLKKMEELMTAAGQQQQQPTEPPTTNKIINTLAPLKPASNNNGYVTLNGQAQPPSLFTKPLQSTPRLIIADELPNNDIVDHLLDIFFDKCVTIASILNQKEFRLSVNNKTCNPFLLYAILSVSARFSTRQDIIESPLWMSGEKYANKARLMIDQVIEQSTMDNLQGILILTINEYGCARGRRCWTYTGLATRMAIEIGLHQEKIYKEMNNTVLTLERWYWYETRRKIYWEAFLQDKFASASTGRPPVLDVLDADILMPVDYNVFDFEEFYQSNYEKTKLIHYRILRDELTREITGIQMNQLDPVEYKHLFAKVGWDTRIIQVAVLLGKVTQFVNRKHNTFDPYRDNQDYEQLDQQLNEWANSLPLQIRNTPANLETYRMTNSYRSAQFVLAHIMHNALIVLLHRPSLVIADMPGLMSLPQAIQDKVQLSMEKCLAAADNVTVMLKDLNFKTEFTPPFVAYLAYTTATVLINSAFSMNINKSQKAELSLNEYFKFLSSLKVYWAMADKLYFLIRDLYAIHQKVMDTTMKANANKSTNSTTSSGGSSSTTTFINPYPASSTIPIRHAPLADLSMSTSINEYSIEGDWHPNIQDPSARSSTNIFSEPPLIINNTNTSSFDLWIQQQQQQQQQERRE